MKFGPVPLAEAEGAIAVHSVRAPGLEVRKGTRIDAILLKKLAESGVREIVAARLEPGDVSEDAAAAAIAARIAGTGVRREPAFTGRANVFAEGAGVVVVDRAAVDALNAVDEAVTLATLPPFQHVDAGDMVATVKILPFAVPHPVFAASLAAAVPLVRVAPYRLRRVAVISTLLPGLADKVIAKTLRVTTARLAAAGASVTQEIRVPHATQRLENAIDTAIAAGVDLVLVFGASAIADRRDVIPAAIEAAGGVIEHFGMPVDPGNLLLVGRIGDVPVIGAPGCARSPKENGFDWVLRRLLAGIEVTRADIRAMGVGGLLMEIATRPQPRAGAAEGSGSRFAAIVLAAGRGTRMTGGNKLLARLGGEPVICRVVAAALASHLRPVVVVTGHEAEEVRAALADLVRDHDIRFVHNPDYAEGMSTSLRAGLAALPEEIGGAAILLGDMPRVAADLVDRLAAAISPEQGALIAVPVREGRRGNPVLWSRRFFAELAAISGDTGARHLIGEHGDAVAEVAVDDEAAFIDIDTREELEAADIERIAASTDIDAHVALDGMKSEDA